MNTSKQKEILLNKIQQIKNDRDNHIQLCQDYLDKGLYTLARLQLIKAENLTIQINIIENNLTIQPNIANILPTNEQNKLIDHCWQQALSTLSFQ